MSVRQEGHHHIIDRIAVLNAILGAIALYPQVYEILTHAMSKDGLSVTSFLLIFTNSLIWLWYGIHRGNRPLIISSSLNAIASGIILVLILTPYLMVKIQ